MRVPTVAPAPWIELPIIASIALAVVALGCDDGTSADGVDLLGTIELFRGDGDREAVDTTILTTDDELEELTTLLEEWDSDAAIALAGALADVDVEEQFVALIEHDRCGVTGTDLVADDGELRFAVQSDGTMCASAEDVVDAYAVEWSATGDDVVLVNEQYDTPRDVVAVTDRVPEQVE
jgi:hypothetical protein